MSIRFIARDDPGFGDVNEVGRDVASRRGRGEGRGKGDRTFGKGEGTGATTIRLGQSVGSEGLRGRGVRLRA